MPTSRPPRSRPDLSLERAAGPGAVVCGIDEVGRGPLAGPVTAAAVVLPPDGLPAAVAALINDSKQVTRTMREELVPAILTHALAVSIASASVEEIDAMNILQASMLAMRRACEGLGLVPTLALVDGNRAPPLACPVRTVVKGDATCLSIAAASIVAKVERDRVMNELHAAFPGYGWDRNAGYPTQSHRAALLRLGPTPHHRRSFGPVKALLAANGR